MRYIYSKLTILTRLNYFVLFLLLVLSQEVRAERSKLIINDNAPVAVDDSAIIDEDETLNGADLLANDMDADGDDLIIITKAIKDAEYGTLTIHVDGTYTYVPDAHFNGTDSFIYGVCDNGTPYQCADATVTITVNPSNDLPYAINDSAEIDEDGLLNGSSLLSNDVDIDGDDLTINTTPISDVINGTLTINVDGSYVYVPNADFHGTDSFVYEICDNGTPILCTQATVTITVISVNDAPVVLDDIASVDEDEILNGSDLLVDVTDVDGDDLAISTTPISDVTNGKLTIYADGTYVYKPDADFNGTDIFVYEICDNGTPQLCAHGTVTITVNPVNDAPVAYDVELEVELESLYNPINLQRPEDQDGDVLTVKILTVVENGKVTINGRAIKEGQLISVDELMSLMYRPDVKTVGDVVMTYEVVDEHDVRAEGKITIKVIPEEIFIPEVITPNGDGYNDKFVIVGLDKYPGNSITIFNRWGNTVFEMHDYDDSWEGFGNVSGRISHDRLPPSTYFYILKLGKTNRKITGNVYMTY